MVEQDIRRKGNIQKPKLSIVGVLENGSFNYDNTTKSNDTYI